MSWGTVPDWIAGLAGLTSAGIALLVLGEARRIRQNNLLHSLTGLWNQYNFALFETGFAKKFGDVYSCSFDERELSKEHCIVIWSLVNVLQFTWTLAKDGLLHNIYNRYQAAAWFYGLKPKRAFFIKFMDDNLVDPAFRNLFATLTSASDLDEARRLFKAAYMDRAQRKYF